MLITCEDVGSVGKVLTDEDVGSVGKMLTCEDVGSVGKMLMSLDSREWMERMTLALGQVMQAAIPRCSGLNEARIISLLRMPSRKHSSSRAVERFQNILLSRTLSDAFTSF